MSGLTSLSFVFLLCLLSGCNAMRMKRAKNECKDLPGWKDKDGDTCKQIVESDWCEDGDEYAVKGVGAEGACCGCGGGIRPPHTDCTRLFPASKYYGTVVKQGGHCKTRTETDRMMFFGDSDMEYWNTKKLFPNSVNCGVGGATAWEAAKFASETAKKYRPKGFVVMTSGENDFGYGGASQCVDSVVSDVKTAVEAFLDSPNSPKVIIIGTKPEPDSKDLLHLYKEYDRQMKTYAETLGGRLIFIDSYAPFESMKATLYKKLWDEDQLHLSEYGYSWWTKWVKEVIAS